MGAAVISEVRAVVGERLPGVTCNDSDSLEGLGFGSIDLIVVLSHFERVHHFTVGEADLLDNDLDSIASIAAFLTPRIGGGNGPEA